MKKICIFLLLLALFAGAFSVSASGEYLFDRENVISDPQKWVLTEQLGASSRHYGVDIVVLTVADFGGRSAKACAESFYGSNDFRDDGILLLVSMTKREYYICTAGSCKSTFNDRALTELEDAIIPCLKRGDVAAAAIAFGEKVEQVLENPSAPQKAAFWKKPLICLGIGAVVALIVVLILMAQLKSVRRKHGAGDYIRPGSLQMEQMLDLYLYQTTTRRAKPQSSSSSSGGRSYGGRGGKF